MTRKLNAHPYAQAQVVDTTAGTALVSYRTIVCGIDYESDGRWIWCNGTFSKTTISHIGWFARELGLSYYDFKQVYLDGVTLNIDTGEVKEI